MQQIQLYDDSLDFTENRDKGPFGGYIEGPTYKNTGDPTYDFFGIPVYSPFGIGAGPLPSTRHIKAALNKGFDIVTLKSVRTDEHPINPFPHVRPVTVNGDLKPGDTALLADVYDEPISVANSFGIPSIAPREWQGVMKDCLGLVQPGQAVLVAFQETARGEGREAFVQDHVQGVRLIRETGASVVEINLSCPNEGEATLACHDIDITTQIVKAVRIDNPELKFFIKLAYFEDKKMLLDLVRNTAPYVDGYSAINTMGVKVVDASGQDTFPGRSIAGVSGVPIKWAGLDMCHELNAIRDATGADYHIVALGGVANKQDFDEYRAAGADTVMSVAAAMWNPDLASEIKSSL